MKHILVVAALLYVQVCQAQNNTSTPSRFALLVGVSKYTHLSESEQLDGCRNDVTAMQGLLQERFGFDPKDITTLTDAAATGAAIRQEIETLKEKVRKSIDEGQKPVVVLHFSGHGSQVPDQEQGHPDCDEADSLDETLVPSDATKQGGDTDLRDDELFQTVEEVCHNGLAKMWIVLDCCHSGTGTRGTTKLRRLIRDFPAAEASSTNQSPASRKLPPGAVMLSACRAHEVEPEYYDGKQTYGLMTRFLVELLNQEAAVSKLSYDLLQHSLVMRYRSDRSVTQCPMPTLEFGDAEMLQTTILGGKGLDRKPAWNATRLDRSDQQILLTAGKLHGVTAGSLFEVYLSPEQIEWQALEGARRNGESAFWAEVVQAEGSSSTCRVLQWQDDSLEPFRLPSGFNTGIAVERFHQHSDGALRVKIVSAKNELEDGPAIKITDEALPTPVQIAIEKCHRPDESPWLKFVDNQAACDVVLKIDGDYAAIFPSTGVPWFTGTQRHRSVAEIPGSLAGGWGPIDLRDVDGASEKLQESLRRVTRARNLIQIAANRQLIEESGNPSSMDVRLQLMKVTKVENETVAEAQPWPSDETSGAITMKDGDRFTFRVINAEVSGDPVYISVLRVDSNMGIVQIHPWQPESGPTAGIDTRVDPGASLDVPVHYICNSDEKLPPIYGPRWAVVLATRVPNQFHLLAQEGLQKARGSGDSSLNDLLLQQTEFKSRGGFGRKNRPVNQYDQSWTADLVQWDVVAE